MIWIIAAGSGSRPRSDHGTYVRGFAAEIARCYSRKGMFAEIALVEVVLTLAPSHCTMFLPTNFSDSDLPPLTKLSISGLCPIAPHADFFGIAISTF